MLGVQWITVKNYKKSMPGVKRYGANVNYSWIFLYEKRYSGTGWAPVLRSPMLGGTLFSLGENRMGAKRVAFAA